MSRYFQYFPTIKYDAFNDGKGIEITNIFRTVKLKKELLDDVTLYTYYDINDGERPDVVSMRNYGTTDYYWTFFVVNDFLADGFVAWPKSTYDMNAYIDHKYDGMIITFSDDISNKYQIGETITGLQSGASCIVLAKDATMKQVYTKTITGTFSDGELALGQTSGSFATVHSSVLHKDAPHHYELDGVIVNADVVGAIPITYYEYENDINDKKTKIRIIRPQYVSRVVDDLISTIQK